MLLQRDPQLAATVEVLKEAFECGRSISLQINDREAPLCGCVSHTSRRSCGGRLHIFCLRTPKIALILTRHEQAAAFMAATHGRLTGRPGVCISTLGQAR
jgi:hypothetical protein